MQSVVISKSFNFKKYIPSFNSSKISGNFFIKSLKSISANSTLTIEIYVKSFSSYSYLLICCTVLQLLFIEIGNLVLTFK